MKTPAQTGLLDHGMACNCAQPHPPPPAPQLQPLSHFLVFPVVSWSIECLEMQLYFKPLYLASSSPLGIDSMLTQSHNGNFLMNIWCCEINKDENSPIVETKKWIIKMYFSHNTRENPLWISNRWERTIHFQFSINVYNACSDHKFLFLPDLHYDSSKIHH